MSTPRHVVIVGGGLAGAKTAEALRAQEFEGDVTLLAAEPHLPYERPPLSKGYLIGKASVDEAVVHPEDWYRDHRIDLRRGTRAATIDAIGHRVGLADGAAIGYDKLVLATGAGPGVCHCRVRTQQACITCVPGKTRTRSAPASVTAHRDHHRRRMDRPGGRRGRPRGPARR